MRWEAGPGGGPPTRTPIPDEALLIQLRQDRAALALAAAGVPLLAAVAARHTAQEQVCRALLEQAGIAQPTTSGTGSPSASASASAPVATSGTTATSVGSPAALAAALTSGLTRLSAATIAASRQRPLVTSLLAHDAATAISLGAAPASLPWPDADPLPAALAEPLGRAAGAAAYALQVAAAHLPAERRPALREVTLALRRRADELAPAANRPLGYVLPSEVGNAAQAEQLLPIVLAGLVDQGLVGLEALPAGTSATVTLGRLLAESLGWAGVVGVPIPAWPGLRVS